MLQIHTVLQIHKVLQTHTVIQTHIMLHTDRVTVNIAAYVWLTPLTSQLILPINRNHKQASPRVFIIVRVTAHVIDGIKDF